MKKSIFMLAVIAGILFSCSEEQYTEDDQLTNIDMSDFYVFTEPTTDSENLRGNNQKLCSSMEVLNRQLLEDPSLYDKMYNVETYMTEGTM